MYLFVYSGRQAQEVLPYKEISYKPIELSVLPTSKQDADYIREALEIDEQDDDEIFQMENTFVSVNPPLPQPLEESWEERVAYINEIELPAEDIYGFYEEKLPDDIIDTPKVENVEIDEAASKKDESHPKISSIKIEVNHKPPYFSSPVIAIVIDDMGISHSRTAKISSLNYALTSSFLTYASGLQAQVKAAETSGHEIMAHLPMEPKASMNVSPDVLTVKMNNERIENGIKGMLDKFPTIRGVNNHMGSRFTEDAMRMDVVMKELAVRNLYFLDSKTTPHSAGEKTAISNRVRHVSRNVFLDNEDKLDYILKQLHQTEAIARKNGYAIAIGHPKEQTYNALKVWLPTLRGRNIRLVHLSEIVKELNH